MKWFVSSIVATMMLLASCAGLGERQGGMSTLANSYVNVIEPILIVAIGAEEDAGNLSQEDATKFRSAVGTIGSILSGGQLSQTGSARTAWDMLRPFAEAEIDRRIEAEEIGPGLGASLKEVIRLFGERLVQMTEAAPVTAAVETEAALQFEYEKALTLSR